MRQLPTWKVSSMNIITRCIIMTRLGTWLKPLLRKVWIYYREMTWII
ncbi:hypothetical protein [Terrimonas sp.]|nr:hypothetical protein [Terrimonas sp.]